MTDAAMAPTTGEGTRPMPPIATMGTVSLVLIVIGGVYMASSFPSPALMALPVALLAGSAALLVAAVVMLSRVRGFAWPRFRTVAGWALLAEGLSAALIAYSFLRNGASGSPLLVVLLMLVVFTLAVPLIIGFTVARYDDAPAGAGPPH